jgi:hypothetical protein
MEKKDFEEIWKELTVTELLVFVLIGNRLSTKKIVEKIRWTHKKSNLVAQYTEAIASKFLRKDERENIRRNEEHNQNNNYLVYLFSMHRKALLELNEDEIEELIKIRERPQEQNKPKNKLKFIKEEIHDFLNKICSTRQKQSSTQVQEEDVETPLLQDLYNRNQLSALENRGLSPQEETPQSKSLKKLKADKRYESLIGREEQINKIRGVLAEDSNRIIAIDGIGGIGKTALTCEIAIRSLEDHNDNNSFESVIWVSAKPEEFTPEGKFEISAASINFENVLTGIATELGCSADIARIRNVQEKRNFVSKLLQDNRYLVIIDNLETVEGYRQLVQNFSGLFYRSRAILTTRRVIGEFNHVQSFRLEGLEQNDSLIFLQKYSSFKIRPRAHEQISLLGEEKLIEIHRFTGGLPLAIELIVGKLESGYTWSTVRDGLGSVNYKIIQNSQASDEDIYRQFYSFIYQDSWEHLSDNAKNLLIDMGEFDLAEGAKIDDLIYVSEIEINKLEKAIAELIQFSLVKRYGVESQQTFLLHPLTHHFVQKDVLSQS